MTNAKRYVHPLIQTQPTLVKMHNGENINNWSFWKTFWHWGFGFDLIFGFCHLNFIPCEKQEYQASVNIYNFNKLYKFRDVTNYSSRIRLWWIRQNAFLNMYSVMMSSDLFRRISSKMFCRRIIPKICKRWPKAARAWPGRWIGWPPQVFFAHIASRKERAQCIPRPIMGICL